MTIYSRILFDEDDNNIIEVRGSENKDHLKNKSIIEYYFKGIFEEYSVDEAIERIKPDIIYIDFYTLSRFSYGFYKKYHKILIEEF